MSQREKLKLRFLSKPRDFTFEELTRLLRAMGYKKMRGGKTSGSRVAYWSEKSAHIIRIHRPHPANVLKSYQLDEIEQELRRKGSL